MGRLLKRCHFGTILFCDAFGLCIVLPLVADLASEFFGTYAAFALSMSAGMKAFFTLFCGPVLGVLSDRFGRQPFLLVAHIPLIVSLFFALLAAWTGHRPLVYLYLIFDALTGALPLLVIFLTIVADDVSPDSRASAFGFVLAVFEVAFMLGPSVGGSLSLSGGFTTALAAVTAGFFLTLRFPESKPQAPDADESLLSTQGILRRSSLPWTQENANGAGGSFRFESRMLRPDLAMRILLSSSMFRSLSLCILCSTMVIGGIQGTLILFIEAQLKFTRKGAALLISFLAFSGLVVQTCLLRPLVRYLGLKKTLVLGLCFQTIENGLFIIAGLVPTSESGNLDWSPPVLILTCGCLLGGFGTVTFPAISALKANACSAEEQGRIQGAISALQAFGMGIGPMAYGGLFSVFSSPQPALGLNRAMYPACYVLSLILLPLAAVTASTIRVPEGSRETGSGLTADTECINEEKSKEGRAEPTQPYEQDIRSPDVKQQISLQNIS